MCGIAGIISIDHGRVAHLERRLSVMSDYLSHRGPDGEGIWVDEWQSAGFAHRRLSIIDPSDRGSQPMARDGVVCVHNGEIYNYLELRTELGSDNFESDSDTETIIHGYRRWGNVVVDHLRGMFAYAVWDIGAQRLHVARDRFGIKPLYYYRSPENWLYFASEAKAILPFLPSIETDDHALREYLVFQYVMEDRTLFRGIRQLPPAHVLTVSDGRMTVEKYWEVYYERDFSRPEPSVIDTTRQLLEDSVRIHTRSDVPIGAYVSGGIDSSLVATLAARETELLAFTGFVDAGPQYDERKFARAAADASGVELLECEIKASDVPGLMAQIVYFMDYPTAGPGVVPQFAVSKLVSQHRKVVLGGQGGDELFGGYVRYLLAYLEQCLKGAIEGTLDSGNFIVTYESMIPSLTALQPYVPMVRDFFSSGLFGPVDRRYLRLVERGSRLGGELRIDLHDPFDPYAAFLAMFNAENVERGSLFDAMTHVDFKTHLPALLHVEDRVGMAHGLESRVPLLDHPLVEFAATMPADVKFKDGNLKRVLKMVAKDILPGPILDRDDKMGFPVPLVEWMQGPLSDWVRDVFQTGAQRNRAYVDSTMLLDKLDRETQFNRTLWGYLSLELWHQRFHDRAAEFRAAAQHT